MELQYLSITVDVSAGTDIDNACKEAVALANHLRLSVWFKFNDVTCIARVGDDPEAIVKSWHKELTSKHQHKIATSSR